MSNIKEIKEAVAFGFAVAAIVKGRLSDGYQTEDLLAIVEALTSEESISALKVALEGASEISTEAGDIDLFETIELVRFAIDQLKTLG
jgi:hypothetical protein